nr:MAG TPA: hypothetical protein [Caudoviricetes sp.]
MKRVSSFVNSSITLLLYVGYARFRHLRVLPHQFDEAGLLLC